MFNKGIKYTNNFAFNLAKAYVKEKDTRQLVLDFSKLVIGDAENKLFVGPLNNLNEEILEVFKMIAKNCSGNVWVALVPHPGKWETNEKKTVVKIA